MTLRSEGLAQAVGTEHKSRLRVQVPCLKK
jgi:hypothetical protein